MTTTDDIGTLLEGFACRRPSRNDVARITNELGATVAARHLVLEGVPHVFRREWSVWEDIRDAVHWHLGTSQTFLRLTGSANMGWSFRTGKPFDSNSSDLDLLVIDQELFSTLENAAHRALTARAAGEEWANRGWRRRAVDDVNRHLRRRFVQLERLPAKLSEHRRFWRCGEAISGILEARSNTRTVKRISFRVYESEAAALRQLARSLASTPVAA